MAFLSKDTLLKAYKVLSTNTDSPSSQGATQKISALRYLFALDRFHKTNNRDCDTKSNDKNSYVSYVGEVVKLSDEYYTSNFYKDLYAENDFKVGSNFFSVNAVKDSIVNPAIIVDFPRREKGGELIKIQNGVLLHNVALYTHIDKYLTNSNINVAFALWLIRNIGIKDIQYNNIKDALLERYSQDLVDTLLPNDTFLSNYCAINGTLEIFNNKAIIKKEDILNLFHIAITKKQNYPLQQIYYGAPGTGKSHSINQITSQQPEENVFRTTFHPDSDYSTFVGCYKPTMKTSERKYTTEELTVKLKEIKNSGTPYPCHKFSARYWESLKNLSIDDIKKILSACGFTDSMNVEVSKGVAIGQEYLNNPEDGEIIYSFTPQAFTNAYVKAWQTDEPVFLIIEEINRGNCAQIFGDLFQLLDRGDDGKSDYSIDADTDLRQYLENELGTESDGIKNGKLRLPSNLHIWATMNTSDQSLFPIDSAFKRRWLWKYIPIANAGLNYKIQIGDKKYDWWTFIEKVNNEIEGATKSEDKKLGYFFAKAQDGIISAETFVSKVVFYLWNDVFKDSFDKTIFKNDITFHKFFESDGSPKSTIIEQFMKDLDIKADGEENIIAETTE